MKFNKTRYHLKNVADGHEFEDEGWTLADPACEVPSLIRAVYENKRFTPREDLDGIYRYADWMPVKRTLKRSCAPVTYKSKGLASFLGLENLVGIRRSVQKCALARSRRQKHTASWEEWTKRRRGYSSCSLPETQHVHLHRYVQTTAYLLSSACLKTTVTTFGSASRCANV